MLDEEARTAWETEPPEYRWEDRHLYRNCNQCRLPIHHTRYNVTFIETGHKSHESFCSKECLTAHLVNDPHNHYDALKESTAV